MADAARREGEKEAREQAARDNQVPRHLLEAARLKAEKVTLEALWALREHEQEAQAIRNEGLRKLAVAWGHLRGQADEQLKNNVP
eukprot:9408262-Pyramimonas_sp.AAC.1